MAQNVVVIDYGSGNLRSVAKALEHMVRERGLSHKIVVSGEIRDVERADRVVLPGVGAFADCRNGLTAIDGMTETLTRAVIADKKPFLGICVGMQLMAEEGLEHGRHTGFGWVKGTVVPISPEDPALKVPHMGWNTLELTDMGRSHPLFEGVEDGDHAYFVHSFHMQPSERNVTLAHSYHDKALTAAIAKDTMAGVQFHPEKSQRAGLTLLGNFLEWQP